MKEKSKDFNTIAGYGIVDIVTNKNNLPWSRETINETIKASYDLEENRFKYLRNFIFTYLRVNKISLEELKQNIHNKSSDLTKSQRDFVINNL